MPVTEHDLAVIRRLTTYLSRLIDRFGERVGDRVAERLEATLDVMTDRELLEDLERAAQERDEDAIPLEDVQRARKTA